MDENRKKLYDQLSANYDMGTFDEFDSDLDNEDNQKVAWEAMGGQDGYGDFGLFQQAIARSPQVAEAENTGTTGNTGSAGDTGNTGSAVAPTEAPAAPMMEAQQPDWTTTGIAMPGEDDADADISLPDAPNPKTPKDQSAGDREIVNEPDVVNDKEQSGNVALHTEDYSTKSVEELYAGLGLENKEYSDEEFQNELRRSAERIGWISDPVVFEQRKAEFNNSLNELQRRMLVQRAAAQVEQMKPPLAHQEVMPGLDATTAQEIADARNKRFDYLLHGESGKQGSPYTRAVSTQSGWVRSNQLIEQARHKDKSELDEITDKALNAMSSDPSQRFGSDEEAAIQLAAAMAEEQAQANGGHAKTPSERELEAYYAGPEGIYVEVDGQHDPHEEQLVRQKDAAFRAEVKRHQEGYTHGLRGYATDIEKDPLASADCPVYAIPRMVKGSVENELREKAKERSFKGDQPGLSSMLAVLDDLEANEYDRHLKNAIRIFGPERYEGYVLAWAKKYYTTIANARISVDNMIRNEIINQLGLKPSNNWEYLFGSVLNNTFVTQGLKALYGLEKGTRPDDFNYITAQQVAYRQYEDEHNNDWQDKLTQMATPALTLVADAVTGGFFLAGKAAQLTSLLPRLFYASGEAASRSLMNSAIYRIFMGSLSGAANFATYEMQSMALQQLATGEYREKHNFWSSLGHAGVSGAAKGMVFGTVGEAFGSLFSGVSGKMAYGVEAGKLLAETATFSAMGYLENGNLTFKDVGTNFGLALSGRASHAGKLIKDIRSRANNDGIYGRKANYHKISEAEKDALVAMGYGDVASALRGENISEPMLRRMQNQLEQMRLDKRVSWETIRCCDWVLNGRLNAVPGVRDKIIEADGKGGYTITAVDANGRAIMGSVHVTGTEARNKVLSSINHEIDKASWVENESKMQSSLIGRQLVETVREYAESTGEDAEALLKTYMTALGKDFDHKSLEPVEMKVYETINALRSGKGQPTDIADTKETIGKRFGVDIDQAIKTEKSQRTKEQRAALAEYQEWLDGREDIIDLHQYRGPAIERPYYGPERGRFERKRELGDDEYTTEVEKWRGGVMLGKVVVVNSLDEVTDAKVRKQIEDGDAAGNKSVPGWYDSKTDTAYIYAPHIIDGKDFNETMLHEVVSHKGLRGLLGEADYNKLLDKIWEDMSPSERKALEDYPGGEENESEVERTRRLADEWLAHRAQGVDVDGRNSIWQTAKRHVKDWLRRHGIDVYYSDYELENKLRESYRELAGKGRKTKTERGSEGEPRKEGPIIEGEPEHIHEDKPDDGAVPPDDGGTTPPEGVAAPPAAEGGEAPAAGGDPPVERPTAAVGRVEGTPADMNDWAELLAENDAASLPAEEVQAGLELMEREREQAHRYANGELADEPSNWEYWAARDGLSEPTRQAEPAATEPPVTETPNEPMVETEPQHTEPVATETPTEAAQRATKLPKGTNAEAETMEPSELPMTEHIATMVDAWGPVTRAEIVGQNDNGTTRVRLWFKNRPNQRGVETDVDLRGPQPPEPPTHPTEPTDEPTATDVAPERPGEVTGSADDQRMNDVLSEKLTEADAEAERRAAQEADPYYMPMENKGGGRMSPNYRKATAEQIFNHLNDRENASGRDTLDGNIADGVKRAEDKVKDVERREPKGKGRSDKSLTKWEKELTEARAQLEKWREVERMRQEQKSAEGEDSDLTFKQAYDEYTRSDEEPTNLEDYVARHLYGTKFKWKDKEFERTGGRTHGLGGHLGLSNSEKERRGFFGWIDEKNGSYPESVAEGLHSDMPDWMRDRYDTMEVLDAVLSVVGGSPRPRDMVVDYAKRLREQARADDELQADQVAGERGFADAGEMDAYDNMREREATGFHDVAAAGREADGARADLIADAQARLNDPNASEFEKQAARTVLRFRQRDGRGGVSAQETEGDGVRFRVRGDEERRPTFYSNAERAVENVKQGKATAEQWKAMLTKAGGIKAGEDKWMGLTDWLDEHKGQSLTKDEVLQFVRDNGIEMREVNYAKELKESTTEKAVIEDGRFNLAIHIEDETREGKSLDDALIAWDETHGTDLHDFYKRGLIQVDEDHNVTFVNRPDIHPINSTRLNYTTRGLENKREIAFVVPGIEPYQENDAVHFGPENKGRAVMWVRFGETTDKDGKRVLVIDEVQSNRHQDAREKGYRDRTVKERYEQAQKAYLDYGNALAEKYNVPKNLVFTSANDAERKQMRSLLKAEQEAHRAYKESYSVYSTAVPDAPFEKNWMEVAMKRMLRLAAEEGFDKVAWTTGEQQAERYGIGDAVKGVYYGDWESTGDSEVKRVEIPFKDSAFGPWLEVDRSGKIVQSLADGIQFVGHNLSELLGKEIANKVLTDGAGSIEGDGLRIGGEGMKGFYDQIVPSFMRKYVKKWGSQVGEVELATPGGEVMHSVDVTDAMRDSVMQGQPLFRVRRAPNGKESRLDERQYDEVRTGNFKKWFGDWENDPENASKVVDANGEPLVVYHGTKLQEYYWKDGHPYTRNTPKFYTFKSGFFSPDRDAALQFAGGNESKLYTTYLDIKKPLVIDAKGQPYDNIVLDDGRTVSTDQIANEARNSGEYDGVIIKNVQGEDNGNIDRLIDDYIPFRPEQIKSATENNGEFSRENGDIRFRARDREYAEAVAAGDREKVESMLREEAERKGYKEREHYQDAHGAPSADVDRADFRNLDALRRGVEEDGFDANLYALANGISMQPDDYWGARGPRMYMYDDTAGHETHAAITSAMRDIQRQMREHGSVEDMPMVKVYRAVPNDIKGEQLEGGGGQWVSPSRTYAENHGLARFGEGAYRIIEQEVPADELWWDGNDAREWGYDDGILGNVYQNTANNRKLLEPTYDDAGNLIPLSERFDRSNSDVRFRVRGDASGGTADHTTAVEDARRRLADAAASEFERQAARAVIKAYGGGSDDAPDGGGPRFRIREPQKAIDDYERAVNSSGFQVTEALQDSMMGLKKLMQAIVGKDAKGKEKAIQDIAGFENAYLKENRLQSESVAQVDEYRTKYYSPLVKAVSALIGKGGKSHRREAMRELTDYMMAKHGLERNIVLAERDATEEFESDANKDGNGNYIRNYDDILAEKREKDYSGLTALTGEADVADAEDAARQMVDAYEAGHDTTELWQRTKEATDATLDKLHESGVLSDEAYTRMKTMFEHYIPLRGWDQTTSDEVYGYLTGPDGPLGGSIVKGAKGRRSQADDPLATIMMMASDGIREANRNVMKQRFLTFVLNNPSDAVSVNRLWLARNAVTDEWQPVFADLDPTDSPEVVRQKVDQFEQDMAQLAQQDPDNFKHGKQAANIPYKVVNGNIGEHRVLVKHNGQTYVLTINGNPRAAQALNGLTNPDTRANNFVGKTLGAFAKLNRVLSQMFTTYSPKFVVRNFARDMGYSIASSAFVKEGGEYGRKFVVNYTKVGLMGKLFTKWEDGTLDRSKPLEDMFYQFMHNGGETGFSAPKELKDYKKALDKELRKENSKTRQLLGSFGEFYLRANRAVENRARFAAFVTSMEMGRGVDRSIWDAKEVSVNFNKKGAGAKMFDNPDQTLAGKTAGLIGDGGRSLFVFWNASVQGLTNYGKTFKAHPVKATAHASLLAGLAYMMPQLMQAIFGDDDGYYDLPDYVRRNNICFRWSKDMPWITIPLSPEHAVSYAIGDIIAGIASGKKQYLNGEEIANDFAKEVSKALPLDFTEGGGGHWWLPSAIKPAYEAYEMNESWTGAPIANQTEWNEQAPEYQRVYKTASKPLVAATELLNNATNSDEDSKGLINLNPSKLEYVFKGYGGGLATLLNDCVRMFDVAFTDAEMEAHDIPIAGSLLKSGNPTTKRKEMMRQYYHYRDDAEGAKWELKNREGDALERFKQTDRYERYLVWKEMSKDVDKLKKQMKDNPDLEAEYYTAVEKLVSAMREQHAGKRKPSQETIAEVKESERKPSQETIAEVKESERKDSIEALTDKQVHDAMLPLSDNAPQDSVDVKREGIKRAYKSEGMRYSKPETEKAAAYERAMLPEDMAADISLKKRKQAVEPHAKQLRKLGANRRGTSWEWDAGNNDAEAYYRAHKRELDAYARIDKWDKDLGDYKKHLSEKDADVGAYMRRIREVRKGVLSDTDWLK